MNADSQFVYDWLVNYIKRYNVKSIHMGPWYTQTSAFEHGKCYTKITFCMGGGVISTSESFILHAPHIVPIKNVYRALYEIEKNYPGVKANLVERDVAQSLGFSTVWERLVSETSK